MQAAQNQFRGFCTYCFGAVLPLIPDVIKQLVPCEDQHYVAGVLDGLVADDRLLLNMVSDTVFLNRCVGFLVHAGKQNRQKRGIITQDHTRQLPVLGADVLADPAVVALINFVFADLQVRLENLNIS